MKKTLLIALIILVFLPSVQGQLQTFNIYDEETLFYAPYTITITNSTTSVPGSTFVFGSNTAFIATENAGGWTLTDKELACDHDTANKARFTCNTAGGCTTGAGLKMSLICEVSIPYSTQNATNNVTFNIRETSSSSENVVFQIFNENTGAYEQFASFIFNLGSGGEGTKSVWINNLNGRYGQDGTARVKLILESTAQTRWFEVLDMWTTRADVAEDSALLITNTQITRNASSNGDIGGLPLGAVTVTLTSDNLDTANDYASRNLFFTMATSGATTRSFYILKTASGSTINFITQSNSNPISGVLLTTQRNLNGSFVTTAEGKSASDGGTPIFLKTNTNYQVIASKAGSTSVTITANPTVSAQYFLSLSSTAGNNFNSVFNDVAYLFVPLYGTIQGGGAASINLSVSAPNSNLQLWGFNATLVRTNGSRTLLNNVTSSQASGGFLPMSINLTNTTTFDRVLVNAFFTKINEQTLFIEKTYTITVGSPSGSSFFQVITNVRTSVDPVSWHIIVALISTLIAGFFAARGGGYGSGFIALGIIGAFTFLGLFSPVIFSVLLLLVGGIYLLSRGYI